eukprot:10398173-Heterocapsa_arctica.AAC.1
MASSSDLVSLSKLCPFFMSLQCCTIAELSTSKLSYLKKDVVACAAHVMQFSLSLHSSPIFPGETFPFAQVLDAGTSL